MSIISRIKRHLPMAGTGGSDPSRSPGSDPGPRRYDEPEADSGRGATPVAEFIDDFVKKNPVVLFMKGSPDAPMCGFSARATSILRTHGKPFVHFNVLEDEEVREGVKQYSNWPTIPQVYIKGEFIGGSDILAQMHESGELREAIEAAYSTEN